MGSSSTATAKCLHCGFPLPPNHVGRCPKCGKVGKAISVSITEVVRISDSLQKSSSDYFRQHGIPHPDWWPGYVKYTESKIPEMVMEVLMEHEKQREKKEKQLKRRIMRISDKFLVGIVVGVIVTIIVRLIFRV